MIKIIKDKLENRQEIFSAFTEKPNVSEIVSDIIKNVKEKGDEALKYYNEKFDKAKLNSLKVSNEEINEAVSLVEPKFIEILERAAKNIREFHEKQKREGFEIKKSESGELGKIIRKNKNRSRYNIPAN